MKNPFRYFNSSPEVIRLAVMMYIRYPLSLRQVEDLLFERGIDIWHETVRFWWNRFGPMFAAEIRKPKRPSGLSRRNDESEFRTPSVRLVRDRSFSRKVGRCGPQGPTVRYFSDVPVRVRLNHIRQYVWSNSATKLSP